MSTLAVDTETTGLELHNGCRAFAVSTAEELMPGQGMETTHLWQWGVDPWSRQPRIPRRHIQEITDYIDRFDRLVFHNAKFDIRALAGIGIHPRDIWDRVEDTLLLSHTLDNLDNHGLKQLACTYCEIREDDEAILKKVVSRARRIAKAKGIPVGPAVATDYWLPAYLGEAEDLGKYATLDAVRTIRLYLLLVDILERYPDLATVYERNRRLLETTYDMEEIGVRVSVPFISKTMNQLQEQADKLERVFQSRAGWAINIRSTDQVAKLLHETLGLPVQSRTKTGKPQLTEATLANMADDLSQKSLVRKPLEALIDYRGIVKSISYLKNYKDHAVYVAPDWFLHPSFNLTGTATTRLSASDPNLQNVGKETKFPLRAVFIPRTGQEWWAFDYDQIELRLVAELAGEERFQQAFANGDDVHAMTGDLFDVDRDQGKTINYQIIYGSGRTALEALVGGGEGYDKFKKAYPRISAYGQELSNLVRKRGYITTGGGARLYVRKDKPYAALNYMVQGTAGDILKMAMVRIGETIHGGSLRLTLHDELVLERKSSRGIPRAFLAQIVSEMVQAGTDLAFYTPASISRIRHRWSEPEEVTL